MSRTKKIFSLLLLLLLLLPSARAKEPKEIDEKTVVLDHSYRDGVFVLNISSEINQELVIYDVLELFQKEKDSKETIKLQKGVHRYKVGAELINGKAAIRLITEKDSVALVEREKRFFEKKPNWLDVEAGAVSGALTGFFVPAVLGYYEKRKETNEPEELL